MPTETQPKGYCPQLQEAYAKNGVEMSLDDCNNFFDFLDVLYQIDQEIKSAKAKEEEIEK